MFHNVTLVDLEELKEKNNSFVSVKNELLWSTQLKENSKSLQKIPSLLESFVLQKLVLIFTLEIILKPQGRKKRAKQKCGDQGHVCT